MQRIYADGKENLGIGLPDDWIQPEKKMNHRSKSRIINLINKIRSEIDGQEQLPRIENTGGIVRLFAVSRAKNKPEVEKLICQKMKEFTNDNKWENDDTNVMTLTLEHHMAARRMGFSTFFDPLYAVDKIKTSLLDGTSTSINLFLKIVLPLYQAHIKNNKFEIANVVKKHSELVNKQALLKEANKLSAFHSTNEKINELLSLWNDRNQPTLLEILVKINETKLFKIPSTLKLVLAIKGTEVTGNDDEDLDKDDDILGAWEVALTAKFSDIIEYSKYINEESAFRTHQGVKGLEFERVMVIIDDDESRGFMFSYDKLFGIKPITPNDQKNIDEGKETGIDRTLRLFYVACSRAKESLAIVSYADVPEQLKENVVKYRWFTDSEVEILK